jgi:hypothetical protein
MNSEGFEPSISAVDDHPLGKNLLVIHAAAMEEEIELLLAY